MWFGSLSLCLSLVQCHCAFCLKLMVNARRFSVIVFFLILCSLLELGNHVFHHKLMLISVFVCLWLYYLHHDAVSFLQVKQRKLVTPEDKTKDCDNKEEANTRDIKL